MPQPDPSQVSSEKLIRIGVSHFPLLGMSTPFTEKVEYPLLTVQVFQLFFNNSSRIIFIMIL